MAFRTSVTLIAAAAAVGITAAAAGAQINPPVTGVPAFESACAAVSGVISGNGSGMTCTWTTFQTEVVKSRDVPGEGDWTVEVSQAVQRVATWNNASATGVTNVATPLGLPVVTRCWNPGGEEKDIDHQHCQLP